MAKRKSFFERIWLKILGRLNTTGGALVVLFTFAGLGAGFATYVCNVFYKIDINEINQKHNIELAKQMHEFEEKLKEKDIQLDELRQKKHILEYNLNKLEHEKNQNK